MSGSSPVDRADDAAWEALQSLTEEAVAYRKRWGWSQIQVAAWMGIAQPSVSATEKGQSSVTLIRFVRYLRAMGLELVIQPIPGKRPRP